MSSGDGSLVTTEHTDIARACAALLCSHFIFSVMIPEAPKNKTNLTVFKKPQTANPITDSDNDII